MNPYSSFTQSGNPRDLERALLSKEVTQATSIGAVTGAISATRTVYGPQIRYSSRIWDGVFLVVSSVSSPVFTLQPQVVIDGTHYDVGRSVSTSGMSFAAGKPFRCHVEEFLDRAVVAGSVLAVKMTRSSGSVTDPVFEFVTVGG